MASVFYFSNGATADSISSLAKILEQVDDDTFSYHCNNEKNDFYNWISDGLGEKALASKIKRIKTRKGLIKKLMA